MSRAASDGLALGPLANGTRAAGAVLAIAYALGLAPGPILVALGGLALGAAGRGMLLTRDEAVLQACSLGLLATALGLGGLRWGSLGTDALSGAQAVLGVTVLVGPTGAAAGAWVGAAAATAALALLLGAPGRHGWIGAVLEASSGALVVSIIFFKWQQPVLWLASAAAVAVVAGAGAIAARRVGRGGRWAVLGVATIAVAAGMALTAAAI